MARRKANTNVVYTGKVGAKMRPKPHRIASRAAPKRVTFLLQGGPLSGKTVRLVSESNPSGDTLPLAPMRGFPAGRYINSKWAPEGEQA
jgi:hypothetical protein